MRANKRNRDIIKPNFFDKILNTMSEFSVLGLNQDMLLNKLNKSGVNVFNVRKKDAKTMYITIYLIDFQKFFAITREMCYNIKKEREYSKRRILFYLSRRIGYVLGAVVLAVVPLVLDDYIFDYSFYGSGSAYYRQVQDYLVENGITKFSHFSDIDYKAISNGILKSNDNFSFVNVYKHGNRLNIELIESKQAKAKFYGDKTQLLSDVSGQVEYVKVYRGTAVVEIGQNVKNGDVLVDGFYKQNDNVVPVNVIATASIIVEKTFEFIDQSTNRQEFYKAIVYENLQDYDVIDCNVQIKKEKTNNKYILTASYRHVISCG